MTRIFIFRPEQKFMWTKVYDENLIPQVGDEIYWISDAGRKWRGTVAHRTLILAPSILPYDMVLDITDYHTASNI
jgi:hypothetical protein